MAENKEKDAAKTLEELSGNAAQAPGEAAEGPGAEGQDGPANEEAGEGVDINKPKFKDLVPASGEGMKHNLDLLMDVTVPITVELGHSRLKIESILQMGPGSVIELDKHADEPVDLKVNGKLMARGEIVVVDDFFGIRISEILEGSDMDA